MSKLYKYYRCLSFQTHAGACGRQQFPADLVDDVVWKFALELIQNPQTLLEGWRAAQVEEAREQTELERQIATLDEEIAQRRHDLEAIVDSAVKTGHTSLAEILTERAETMAAIIDELTARRNAMAERVLTDGITDEDIGHFVSEAEALRVMYEALHDIDREADFSAKRELIDILNLRATLRTDEEGRFWVDIHWLTKTYPKEVCVQKTYTGRDRGRPSGNPCLLLSS